MKKKEISKNNIDGEINNDLFVKPDVLRIVYSEVLISLNVDSI